MILARKFLNVYILPISRLLRGITHGEQFFTGDVAQLNNYFLVLGNSWYEQIKGDKIKMIRINHNGKGKVLLQFQTSLQYFRKLAAQKNPLNRRADKPAQFFKFGIFECQSRIIVKI